MADEDELRRMINIFRVSELHTLLAFVGRNRTGRKDQLQSKALELIKLGSVPVQMKIRELHKNILLTYNPTLASGNEQTSLMAPVSFGNVLHCKQPTYQVQSTMPEQSHTISKIPLPSVPPAPSGFSCIQSHMVLPDKHQNLNYPIHPDVQFRTLPFYEFLGELLRPASLVPNGSSKIQEGNYHFHFTPRQATDISSSRDSSANDKFDYTVQVHMRFCLVETSCEQDDNFPHSIFVKVNGKVCPLPPPIPTNKPGIEPKRPSVPVNITGFCKLSPTVPNWITVTWASEFGKDYAVGINLVKRLTSSQLLMKLRSRGIRNSDHTRALIKEKLTPDADSEIATTSLRASLICPLGKLRMQVACRANMCTHIQCFDALLYLQMNEKKPLWICPVCDKPATFDSLQIDGLFMEIINASESNNIQFYGDGSWFALSEKSTTREDTSVVDITSTDLPSKPVLAQKKAAAPACDIIDLTLSSDEGEKPRKPVPAPKRKSKRLCKDQTLC